MKREAKNDHHLYHNAGHWSKVVFVVAIITLRVSMQALCHVVWIIVRDDHQGAGSACTIADAVPRTSASSARSAVWMTVLTDAILIAILGDWTLRHAVRTVTGIATTVTLARTLQCTQLT